LLKYVPEWFPGVSFKKKARIWKGDGLKMMNAPFDAVMKDIENGVDGPNFVSSAFKNIDETKDIKFQREIIQQSAASIYVGGSATSISTLNTFILAMILYPEVQKKAQQELDGILQGRLPEYDDQRSLPYISAIVNELFRWQPVTPVAIPHSLIKDDIYEGYRLPKGSVVIGNAWAMLHDETIYPDPMTFNPDRWMKNGKLNPDIPEPQCVFGFGRRICPGRFMGISTAWITVASVLAVFNITKGFDEHGNEVAPRLEYTSSTIRHPLPFRCTIRPRSKNSELLVRSAA